jgi:outer membrane protein OmpA-like peptidoglycan-associated protein
MTHLVVAASVATALLTGCSQPPPAAHVSTAVAKTPLRETPPPAAAGAPVAAAAIATAAADQDPVLGGVCAAGDAAAGETAVQATARIPLKVGLTLVTAWHRTTEADDVECLTQVRELTASAVVATASCALPGGTVGGSRQVCRDDFDGAYIYDSGAGDEQDTIKGTTMFSLSRAAFRELKERQETKHRNVSFYEGALVADLRGTLAAQGQGSFAAIVNDHLEELPVVRAEGRLQGTAMGKPIETQVRVAVLDDERFPLVLDYSMPDVGATGFFVRYTRISFPTERQIEDRLTSEKRVDVYGIYFDFASDRLRAESEPVLREIADTLARHPDWALSIDGHTDGIGGERANQQLSERRSAAVRDVLVRRYGIDGTRLTARGFGATRPKDSNDARDGRARNRRVELVRQ